VPSLPTSPPLSRRATGAVAVPQGNDLRDADRPADLRSMNCKLQVEQLATGPDERLSRNACRDTSRDRIAQGRCLQG